MNMKNIKKFTALFLVLILIFTTLISCNPSSKNNISATGNDNTTADPNATAAPGGTTAEERIDPNLPSEDYGGYTFTFLAHQINYPYDWVGDAAPREITAEAENGDPINDSVYKRNAITEDKYNITIKMVPNTDEKAAMNKAVKAGDNTYDAVVIFNNNVPSVITGGLLVDTSQLPYINLKQPWWDPAVNALSIAHKNFLLGGDLLILDKEATNCLLFNKDMMANLGLPFPYDAVKQGKWTMDALNNIIKNSAKDLNGDGQMTAYDDQWGLGLVNDALHAFLVSCGGALAVKDNNDIPYMDFTSQKNLSVISKAMDVMYNPNYVVNGQAPPKGGSGDLTNGNLILNTGFEESRILFMWARIRVVEALRDMNANFGIVPMPKYDETQSRYYSLVNPYTGVLLGVPKSSSDLNRTSIILEALSAESRYTLQPAYYDVTLQRKYARDNESQEMLNIIFSSKIYDIGSIYSFGNVFLDFITLAATQNRDVVSYYEKKSGAMQAAIDKVVNTIQSIN